MWASPTNSLVPQSKCCALVCHCDQWREYTLFMSSEMKEFSRQGWHSSMNRLWRCSQGLANRGYSLPWKCVYVGVYVWMCVCLCVHMCVAVYIYVCGCLCVCVNVWNVCMCVIVTCFIYQVLLCSPGCSQFTILLSQPFECYNDRDVTPPPSSLLDTVQNLIRLSLNFWAFSFVLRTLSVLCHEAAHWPPLLNLSWSQ